MVTYSAHDLLILRSREAFGSIIVAVGFLSLDFRPKLTSDFRPINYSIISDNFEFISETFILRKFKWSMILISLS